MEKPKYDNETQNLIKNAEDELITASIQVLAFQKDFLLNIKKLDDKTLLLMDSISLFLELDGIYRLMGKYWASTPIESIQILKRATYVYRKLDFNLLAELFILTNDEESILILMSNWLSNMLFQVEVQKRLKQNRFGKDFWKFYLFKRSSDVETLLKNTARAIKGRVKKIGFKKIGISFTPLITAMEDPYKELTIPTKTDTDSTSKKLDIVHDAICSILNSHCKRQRKIFNLVSKDKFDFIPSTLLSIPSKNQTWDIEGPKIMKFLASIHVATLKPIIDGTMEKAPLIFHDHFKYVEKKKKASQDKEENLLKSNESMGNDIESHSPVTQYIRELSLGDLEPDFEDFHRDQIDYNYFKREGILTDQEKYESEERIDHALGILDNLLKKSKDPDKIMKAFKLMRFEDKSIKEVAKIIGIPRKTIHLYLKSLKIHLPKDF